MGLNFTRGFDPASMMARLYKRGDDMEDEVARVVEEGAEAIKEESIANSPVDLGNLEGSHRVEKRHTYRHNVAYDIIVGGMVNGVDVDDYIDFIHESIYNLGEKSLLKQASDPLHTVGPKFLERAFDTLKPYVVNRIRQAIKRHW